MIIMVIMRGGTIHVGVRIKWCSFLTAIQCQEDSVRLDCLAGILTWLDSRHKLDTCRTIADDSNNLVGQVVIVRPGRGMNQLPLETLEIGYVGPFPVTR